MSLPAFSLPQALSVWDELVEAYYGENGFGGTTAEVYAYCLLPHSPGLETFLAHNSTIAQEQQRERAREASEGLRMLLELFCKQREDCDVEVDGVPFEPGRTLIPPEEHRWHIYIRRRGERGV